MSLRVTAQEPSLSAAVADNRRARQLEGAVKEFEAQLMGIMIKEMHRAYLEEDEGAAGVEMDFAQSALASGLTAGEAGERLTGGLLAHLQSLDRPAGGASAATLPAAPPPGPAAAAPPPRAPLAPAAAAGPRPAISSGFGERLDPLSHEPRFHRGLDLRAARGTPVAAASDGVVVAASVAPGLGKHVVVRHAGGLDSVYAHLERIDVAPGAAVSAGTPIGAAGSTGRSTGPHLHFEVRRDGHAVDPAEVVGRGQGRWVWPLAGARREVVHV